MSPESNKKSPRTFQCRQSLWQKFEQMAKELECSVDYLINDAMKQYARQRGYGPATKSPEATSEPGSARRATGSTSSALLPPPAPPPAQHAGSSSVSRTMGSGAHRANPGSSLLPNLPLPGAAPPLPGARSTMSLPPAAGARVQVPPPPGGRSLPPPPPGAGSRSMPVVRPPVISTAPPAKPAVPGRAHAPSLAAARLAIRYRGQLFTVNKERFIIGRGKQSSDLTIKDPNVSRQHAMIEFSNGQYYIVDMGSTNGVEFEGKRVQRKNIHDRDRFRVCDHELEFLYQ